jgi:hypothetical protein
MVERSPEKAGVGGSIPSLATIFNFQLVFCSWWEPPTSSRGSGGFSGRENDAQNDAQNKDCALALATQEAQG